MIEKYGIVANIHNRKVIEIWYTDQLIKLQITSSVGNLGFKAYNKLNANWLASHMALNWTC